MGLKDDAWIAARAAEGMIEPFASGGKRPGVVSFGLSSYGYDFRLAPRFVVPSAPPTGGRPLLDPKGWRGEGGAVLEAPHYDLPAGSLVLGQSLEYFRIPANVLTLCQGKSTYARLGIIVNVTPFEPGWEGNATLSILNGGHLPVRLHGSEGIAQLLFFEGDAPPQVTYADKGGKYQATAGIATARLDGDPTGQSR